MKKKKNKKRMVTTCPYCGEEILVTAKKCKHCGEWLVDDDDDGQTEVSDDVINRLADAINNRFPKTKNKGKAGCLFYIEMAAVCCAVSILFDVWWAGLIALVVLHVLFFIPYVGKILAILLAILSGVGCYIIANKFFDDTAVIWVITIVGGLLALCANFEALGESDD